MSISGDQIKDARGRQQMTQQELADAVGVSLRTVGSWERGEAVPRNRLGAVREVLRMSVEERDGRVDLARLIREQLEVDGIGPHVFAKRLSEASRRPFFSWYAGSAAPQAKNRPALEDALGWERGSVSRILEVPITERITLAEVRDWAQVDEPSAPVARASQLSLDELLIEAMRRAGVMQAQIDALRAENESLKQPVPADEPVAPVRNLFDLAAHNADHPGRMSEHLEEDD